ncbi:MAG: hypothetical protein QM804_01015 [Propionicimonas sp.]
MKGLKERTAHLRSGSETRNPGVPRQARATDRLEDGPEKFGQEGVVEDWKSPRWTGLEGPPDIRNQVPDLNGGHVAWLQAAGVVAGGVAPLMIVIELAEVDRHKLEDCVYFRLSGARGQ